MAINDVLFEERGVDHENEKRALITAFNGDIPGFVAREASVLQAK